MSTISTWDELLGSGLALTPASLAEKVGACGSVYAVLIQRDEDQLLRHNGLIEFCSGVFVERGAGRVDAKKAVFPLSGDILLTSALPLDPRLAIRWTNTCDQLASSYGLVGEGEKPGWRVAVPLDVIEQLVLDSSPAPLPEWERELLEAAPPITKNLI